MLIVYPTSVRIPVSFLAVEGVLMEQMPNFVDPMMDDNVRRWIEEPFVDLVTLGCPGSECVWKDILW